MKKTKLPTDPAEQLRALIAASCKPGLTMICYAHDAWCPAGDTQGAAACICEPDVYLVEEIEPEARAR